MKRDSINVTEKLDSFWLILLFIIPLALYGNTIFHSYALDDEIVILNKYVQQGIKGISTLFTKGYAFGYNGVNEGAYRPLTLIMFALEVDFFGNNPIIHHLVNVLIYCCISVLLFVLLKKTLTKYNRYLPVVITILFISHPVHTEVVANIKSRDELLNLLFLLGCLLFLVNYHSNKNKLYFGLSLLSFFMALLSKENAITFLTIIPLTFYYFYNENIKQSILLTIPFVIVAGIYLLMRQQFLTSTTSLATQDIINNSLAGAKNGSEKYATIFYILGKYLILLIFPYKLTFDYSYKEIVVVNWSNFKAILPFLIIVALSVYAFLGIKKRSVFSYSILFFLITLSIALNIFVDIGATMAERFLFLPSLGFCIAVGVLIIKISKAEFSGKLNATLASVVAIIFILFSIKTIKRNADWKDNITLFSADIKNSPLSARAHYNLGVTLDATADSLDNEDKKLSMYEKAIIELKKTTTIYPKYTEAYDRIGLIYNKLGLAYGKAGMLNEAIDYLNQSISYDSNNASAYLNLGVAWLHKNNADSAIYNINKSISLKEGDPMAALNLGVAYGNKGVEYHNQKGDLKKAISYYRKGLEVNPNQPNLYNNLRMAYEGLGMKDSANYFQRNSTR